MTDQNKLHAYVDWMKERLDEIDATLASLESSATAMQADARTKADAALTAMRSARDVFRKSLKEHAQSSEAAFERSKAALV